MPQCLRDSVIVPLPKENKDASDSSNRPVAFSSILSKVMERLIFSKFVEYFSSSFFKADFSATLCTGTVKNVIIRYIHNGLSVLGCFLDAFDVVDHDILWCAVFINPRRACGLCVCVSVRSTNLRPQATRRPKSDTNCLSTTWTLF